MNGCVAVLDLGKTNTKLVVFDRAGKLVAERSQASAPLAPDGRWPYLRLDTERAWAFYLGALKDVGKEFPIEAVSVAAHGAAGVLVTEDGVAAPPVDYEFDGFAGVDAEYDALRPPFEESLTPNLPRGLNLARQILYVERTFPKDFAAARAFLVWPQYWSWRLSGVMASEVASIAVHSDLWRPMEGRLSSLVERLGWTRLFPPIRRAWETLGPLKPEVAAATGLSPEVRIVCGTHDFKRVARSPSRGPKRSLHRCLDRHLGHPDGGRRQGQARPEGGHADERRRARRPPADRAFHGRAGICHSRWR